ncbi:uncharacterized protein LOC143884043 isoform X2 [Tasmannia lanceolata]|uniref:uncharacterized protein LOC143884043 isoform X2 n=1 Tax=Tasmannia lanceolata TaxID=3420 RepID=UPI004062B02D
MAEDSQSDDSSLSFSCEIGLGETKTHKMAISDKERFVKRSESSDSFVLDIEALSHIKDKDLTASPRSTLQKNLSRKVSQRVERKAAERETDASKGGLGVGISTVEKSVVVPVANIASSEGTSSSSEVRLRRFNSISNRRSFWLNPRRILFAFATVSSMGTLILIYFTLTIRNTMGEDSHAQ